MFVEGMKTTETTTWVPSVRGTGVMATITGRREDCAGTDPAGGRSVLMIRLPDPSSKSWSSHVAGRGIAVARTPLEWLAMRSETLRMVAGTMLRVVDML